FQKPRQDGAEIEPCLGGADAAKVVDAPDHAGGTKIEAGVTVANSFIERMRGPESLSVQALKPIRHYVLDRGDGLALIPGDRPQRHVTGRFGHAPTITREPNCAPVIKFSHDGIMMPVKSQPSPSSDCGLRIGGLSPIAPNCAYALAGRPNRPIGAR